MADVYFLRRQSGSETTALTESISVDGGSSYSTVGSNMFNSFVTPGTSIRTKLAGTVQSSEIVVANRVDIIAIKQNT